MARTKLKETTVLAPHWTEGENYLNADRFQDRVRARNARHFPDLFPGVTPSDVPLFPKLEDVARFSRASDLALFPPGMVKAYALARQEEIETDMAAWAMFIKDRYQGESYGTFVNLLIQLWPSVDDSVIRADELAESLDVALESGTLDLIRSLASRLNEHTYQFAEDDESIPTAALPVELKFDDHFVCTETVDGVELGLSNSGMLYVQGDDESWAPMILACVSNHRGVKEFLAAAEPVCSDSN